MKCPFCGESEDKVVDSRLNKNCEEIRRRRQCNGCGRRFTTYERIEEISVMISKKDGRREIFNREKLRVGIQKACEKRDISTDTIEKLLDELEKELGDTGKKEIPSCMVGEKVIAKLNKLDDVAYVRFASVYREFKDVNDFASELENLLNK